MDNQKDIKTFQGKFAYYDRTGMQDYLERKALEGWQLYKKQFASDWEFKRIVPRKLHYAITYIPQYSNEDSFLLSKEKDEYIELCTQSGWQYVCVYKNMVIFLSEEENPLPLETDPETELETINKAVLKNYMPKLILLTVGLAALSAFLIYDFFNNTIEFSFGLGGRIYILTVFVLLFAFYTVTELLAFFRWRKKAVAAAAIGKFTSTSLHNKLSDTILVVVCILSVLLLLSAAIISNDKTAFGFLAATIASAIVSHFIDKLKEKYSDGWKKHILNIISVLVFIALIACSYFIEFRSQLDKEPVETYKSNFGNHEFHVYKDDIPLKLEDLEFDINSKYYSYCTNTEKSLFVVKTESTQTARLDAENYSQLPELRYTVYEIRKHFLYERCLADLLNDAEDYYSDGQTEYEETASSLWNANKVYQLIGPKVTEGRYLICYDNSIVEIVLDSELTTEQIKIAAKTFNDD